MLDRLTGRWTGVALSLLTVIGTLWLAVTGNLDLYVHPRYYVFTVVMGILGGLAALAALLFLPAKEDDEHAHHDEDIPRPAHQRLIPVVGRLVVVAAAAVGILVLPPTTLSSQLASNRELNSVTATGTADQTVELASSDGSTFTIKDWAGLLRQGLPVDYFTGKTADVTGFVLAGDSPDTFYLTRFHLTHCAIDAQPVGVPVHWPDWERELQPDQWLSLSGSFDSNPSASVDAPVVLVPTESEAVAEPDDPYVY